MEPLRYSTIKYNQNTSTSNLDVSDDHPTNKNFTFGKYFELILLKQEVNLTNYPNLEGDFIVAGDGVRLPREHRDHYNILREKDIKLARHLAGMEYAYFDNKIIELREVYDIVTHIQPEITGDILGLPFAGTPDFQAHNLYFDIKTTSALNYREINEHFTKYNYDVQGYIYHSLTNTPIYFIFYLKNTVKLPYIRTFPGSTRELGRAKNKLINLIKTNYPSYLLP